MLSTNHTHTHTHPTDDESRSAPKKNAIEIFMRFTRLLLQFYKYAFHTHVVVCVCVCSRVNAYMAKYMFGKWDLTVDACQQLCCRLTAWPSHQFAFARIANITLCNVRYEHTYDLDFRFFFFFFKEIKVVSDEQNTFWQLPIVNDVMTRDEEEPTTIIIINSLGFRLVSISLCSNTHEHRTNFLTDSV